MSTTRIVNKLVRRMSKPVKAMKANSSMTNPHSLSVFDRHQLVIAYDTMRMSCVGAAVMGGPNHAQAVDIICRLTGKSVVKPADCTCKE